MPLFDNDTPNKQDQFGNAAGVSFQIFSGGGRGKISEHCGHNHYLRRCELPYIFVFVFVCEKSSIIGAFLSHDQSYKGVI